MKKISTLILLLTLALTMSAQQHGAAGMKFVGKATVKPYIINPETGEATGLDMVVEFTSDTMTYIGGRESASFITPELNYNFGEMVITLPSYQIDGTTFTGGYGGVTWPEQDYTVNIGEESVTGKLSGTFTHANNIYELKMKLAFSYSLIDKIATPVKVLLEYEIDGFYLKETSGKLDVNVAGGQYSAPSVTYVTRTYTDGDATKVDVQVPAYVLEGTPMGNISVGGYTVQGLTWDETLEAYNKDYSNDGLSLYFSNGSSLTGDYPLNKAGQKITVKFNGTSVSSLVNTFQPGNMPFVIISTFPGTTSGISSVSKAVKANGGKAYNAAGQQVSQEAKGFVIIDGKKFFK
ncbi:MAG: hypothetical protein IJ914_05425 [Prevotella sp.]|nr:hypothetical protein [Prevotella sp.]